MIATAALDMFIDDLIYAQRLIRAGVPTELYVAPGAFHGFDAMVPDARISKIFTQCCLDALHGLTAMAHVWTLHARPQGRELSSGIFTLSSQPDAELADGEVRVRNLWLSVDPFMRGMLDDYGSYMPSLALGRPMNGGAIAAVIESRSPTLPVGSTVVHNSGWRDIAVVSAAACDLVTDSDMPIEHYLGHFGMPGVTAYFGLLHLGAGKAGETVFVSSAAGAVGTAVVQIAKAVGMRVVGSAGGPDKCKAVRDLGADAMVVYKAPGDLSAKLAKAAPAGIDLYFDNVAGDHLAAAIDNARTHIRVTLCGMISGYGRAGELCIRDPMRLVSQRIRLQGYFAPDYYHLRPKFLADMRGWLRSGALACPTVVHEGLESMPNAFVSLFAGGGGVGKMLVRLS
jgi:NADPH-dependent curcumin reductase CurA